MDPSYEFCLEIETFGPADGCAILAAAGEIDVVTAPLLRERLAEFAAAGPVHLIADLSRVTFLDAAGLGALAGPATSSAAPAARSPSWSPRPVFFAPSGLRARPRVHHLALSDTGHCRGPAVGTRRGKGP